MHQIFTNLITLLIPVICKVIHLYVNGSAKVGSMSDFAFIWWISLLLIPIIGYFIFKTAVMPKSWLYPFLCLNAALLAYLLIIEEPLFHDSL